MIDALDKPSYWQELYGVLKGRFLRPWKHPTFVMYFFLIIVFVGGFGLLVPIVSCYAVGSLKEAELHKTMVIAAYTYFIAIAATAAVDLILSYRHRKYLLMFFAFVSVVVFFCAVLAAIHSARGNLLCATVPAVIGYVLSLFLWWVGNADNANLLDEPLQPTAPTGGDAKRSLSGTVNGYEVN